MEIVSNISSTSVLVTPKEGINSLSEIFYFMIGILQDLAV